MVTQSKLCLGSTAASKLASDPEDSCLCGCTLRNPHGSLSYSPSRCRGTVVWLIVTSPDRVVDLTYFPLRDDDDGNQSGRSTRNRRVKILDGAESGNRTLWDGGFAASRTETVRSSKNAIRIEVYEAEDSTIGREGNEEFFANYTTLAAAALVPIASRGRWKALTAVCAIVLLCIAVVITVVSVIFCQKRFIGTRRGRTKKSNADQALLGSGIETGPVRDQGPNRRDAPNLHYSFAETTTPPESPSRGRLLTHAAFYRQDSSHSDLLVRQFQSDGKCTGGFDEDATHKTCAAVDGQICSCSPIHGNLNRYPDYCPTGLPNLPFRPGLMPSGDDLRNDGHSQFRRNGSTGHRASPLASPVGDTACFVDFSGTTQGSSARQMHQDRTAPDGGQSRFPNGTGGQPIGPEADDKGTITSQTAEAFLQEKDNKHGLRFTGNNDDHGLERSRGAAVRSDTKTGDLGSVAVRTPPSSSAPSVDGSPFIGGGGRLYPDALSVNTLSDVGSQDELEYDDYFPQLPGSFFHMDHRAYTLTWSKPLSSQKRLLEGGGGRGRAGEPRPSAVKMAPFSGSEANIGK